MKTKYVLGFAFSSNKKNVVLIKKEKPVWQVGLLNGVGGKIESNESNTSSIKREFEEETGVHTLESDWSSFCEMEGPDFIVYCFKLFSDEVIEKSTTTEKEVVFKIKINELDNYPHISNLKWLIQMALDDNYNKNFYARIQY